MNTFHTRSESFQKSSSGRFHQYRQRIEWAAGLYGIELSRNKIADQLPNQGRKKKHATTATVANTTTAPHRVHTQLTRNDTISLQAEYHIHMANGVAACMAYRLLANRWW